MAEALVSDPRGLKRICMSCGTRFYDMNKRPIICPNCSTEFTGEFKVKTRRGRLSALDSDEGQVSKSTAIDGSEEAAEDDDLLEDEETVSLEDVELEDDSADDADDDLAIDDDLDNLDTDDDLDIDDDLDDEDDLDVDVEDDDK